MWLIEVEHEHISRDFLHFATHALCNTGTLQQLHFTIRAFFNTCTLQLHFATGTLCNMCNLKISLIMFLEISLI